jgi:hypothetical protein
LSAQWAEFQDLHTRLIFIVRELVAQLRFKAAGPSPVPATDTKAKAIGRIDILAQSGSQPSCQIRQIQLAFIQAVEQKVQFGAFPVSGEGMGFEDIPTKAIKLPSAVLVQISAEDFRRWPGWLLEACHLVRQRSALAHPRLSEQYQHRD